MSSTVLADPATETPTAVAAPADPKAGDTQPNATDAGTEPGQDQSKPATLLTAETPEPKAESSDDPKQASPVVPEAYEIALPKETPLSADVLAKVSELAKGLSVTDSKAVQGMVDLIHAEAVAVVEAHTQAVQKGGALWTETVKRLEADALADKDIGGTPERLAQSIGKAQSVLKEFGTPEFAALLDDTGYGSHPALIKLLAKVKDAMGEDKTINGEPPRAKPKTMAQAIYPDLPSKDG